MNPVHLNLPGDARILFNALYPTAEPSYLTQDLLAIELPDGVFVDVGWYPENDPGGKYQVSVFRGDWNNAVIEPIITSELAEVVVAVQSLAQRFSHPSRLVSSTSPG